MQTLDIRRAATRGIMQLDWLDARFSFSFGSYRDPERDSFGVLLALNEDKVKPNGGFLPHPHRDLEIFIMPLSGMVEHRDNLGNQCIVTVGDVQKMSAGTGIVHSQMNRSSQVTDHHIQIWLQPRRTGTPPSVEQRHFERADRAGRWQLLVSPDGRGNSLPVDQDSMICVTTLKRGHSVSINAQANRSAYVHVIRGALSIVVAGVAPEQLAGGDACALPVVPNVELQGMSDDAEVLWFDLPLVTGSSGGSSAS